MKNQRSFTLIEVLVVIAIIGLLSSIVLVSTQGSREKAKFAKTLQFSRTVQNTLGAYTAGWWSFETIAAGKVLDSSGYGKDGTVNGAVLTSDPDFEQLGNILSFDGLDDYVDFGTSAHYISTEGTIELWFYLESVTDNDNLIELYENNSNRLTVYLFDTEGMLFKIVDGGATYNVWSDSALSLARWYHVVFTYGANGMQMYINGEKQDETTSHAGAFSTTAPSFRISYQVGVPSRKLDGFADEVRIYEQAMSATEIQKHYVQGLAKHKDLAIK